MREEVTKDFEQFAASEISMQNVMDIFEQVSQLLNTKADNALSVLAQT